MDNWTKEPWKANEGNGRLFSGGGFYFIMDKDYTTIAQVPVSIHSVPRAQIEDEANALRIVTCVNALEGISNEALESGVVKEMVAGLREIKKGDGAYNQDPLTHASNCIDNMTAIASFILDKLEGGK